MNEQKIFFGVVVIVLMGLAYGVISKRGRNTGVRLIFGEVVEDLGSLEKQQLKLGSQSTRMLHCRQDGEDFLVLETTDKVGLSVQTTWTKIDDGMLDKINSLVKAS